MPEHVDIFISSTTEDLIEYRKIALRVCHRLGMFPIAMEDFGPDPRHAVDFCRQKVYEAEIYLGIFAYRYGWQPEGYSGKSITELEYHWAMERGIPVFIFIADPRQPWPTELIDLGDKADRLEEFKNHLMEQHVVSFFTPDLEKFREDLFVHLPKVRKETRADTPIHYIGEIPKPPEPYIAHPYTLLETNQLFGRHKELELMTDWIARPSTKTYSARALTLVAIGGMGKSALSWTWFNTIAPHEMTPLAGRVWWSFYESDAHFENFVTRTLAYVTGRKREEIEHSLSQSEREDQLLQILDRSPYLVVLDGLERVLLAYARMDAAYLADDDLDERTANYKPETLSLSDNLVQSFAGQRRLRKTADPRVGNFLRRLATIRRSRVLISTRLYPADLQTDVGSPIVGTLPHFMTGLHPIDALKLWQALGVSGSGHKLLPMFDTFDNHPLLIRALAGEVYRYRRAPGDFDRWLEANPGFDPFSLPIVQRKSHVLAYAMTGLNSKAREVLQTIAAFRMPAAYEILVNLLVGEEKSFQNENNLDDMLTELEDRGLMGWDRRANRYDLHPIVRGVAWNELDDEGKYGVYERLHSHFQSIPVKSPNQITSVDDLAPDIELYSTLVGMGRYDDAYTLMYRRLTQPLYSQLSANHQFGQLLEMLFPEGLNKLPKLNSLGKQAVAINLLANCYLHSEPGKAEALYRRNIAVRREEGNTQKLSVIMGALAYALLLSGKSYAAEVAARQSLILTREFNDRNQEAVSLYYLGLTLGASGKKRQAGIALQRALRIRKYQKTPQGEGVINAYIAQLGVWAHEYKQAQIQADLAWKLANNLRFERDFIRAARLQGVAALGQGNMEVADKRLHYALTRARSVNFTEEELGGLIGIAELMRQYKQLDQAYALLGDVWEAAERGPYPLLYTDALNVLAQMERDAGNTQAAVEAAVQAYQKSWCDGISADGKKCYAYWWGLRTAKAQLDALHVPYPTLQFFDASRHEPMPEVEINPPDEFGGEEKAD